jgi:DnaJ domain
MTSSTSATPESTPTHYDLLGLKPNASVQQIRQAYRDLSKLYHPDTTELPDDVATRKFQALNEAYATLSSPEKRLDYDYKIGYSRFRVMQAPVDLDTPKDAGKPFSSRHLYLDPTDRPLSAGELFALFILGITFAACLALVVFVGVTKGDQVWFPWVSADPPTQDTATAPVAPLPQTAKTSTYPWPTPDVNPL